ncbi:hypothetical protein [Helicobacter sp. L8]|uniref:hypothetical protein n=1 Tax=Helicobacter sp. L8 TaxID=2316078 RepID=UPI001F095187|nr:hypothetical protein [Helicobacter sp. L8]
MDLKLPNYYKVNIVLDLFSNLRNACFHWENLAKTRVKDGIAYPRLSVRVLSGEMGMEVQISSEFTEWLKKLKDFGRRDTILRRIDTLRENGHFGDHKHISGKIFEL